MSCPHTTRATSWLTAQPSRDSASVRRRCKILNHSLRPSTKPDVQQKYLALAGEADSTLQTYLIYIRQWTEWATFHECPVAPARASDLTDFFYSRVRDGVRPQTLDVYKLALASYHTAFGLVSPITEEVETALKNIKRKYGTAWRRTPGITRKEFHLIEQSAYSPRRKSRGGMESCDEAMERGLEEVGLIAFMRDGLLAYRDVSRAQWSHMTTTQGGTHSLTITTRTGEVHRAYISQRTVELLLKTRTESDVNSLVVPLSWKQMTTRIKRAAKHAGLGEGYNLGSPRLGMAEDLINAGEGLPAVMAAGRWKTPKILMRYFGDEIAARDIEQFFEDMA